MDDDLIYKTGTQSAADPFEFVMSDETVDRMGDVIEAEGWSITEFKKNPIALFGHDSKMPIGTWKNVRVVAKQLVGKLELAAEGTSEFIDTLRKLMEQRILKAVSVGFHPKEYEPIEKDNPFGGYRFTKQTLLECSLVSVPANPNALSLAKSLSSSDRALLFAKPGILPQRPKDCPTAKPGSRTPSHSTGSKMSLAQRIATLQDELIVLRDTVTPLARKIEDGDDLNEAEMADFTRINGDIAAGERQLIALRSAESVLAGRSQPAIPGAPAAPAVVQARHMDGRRPNERPSDLLFKMGVLAFHSHVQRIPQEQVRQMRYAQRDDLDAVLKSVTNPAMTTVAGWAAELVETAIQDFLELLRPDSVYSDLSGRGVRFTFGRNGVIKIPRRTGSGTGAAGDLRGAFVGEGDPIPVRRGAFASVSLTPRKMGVISHYTREMAQHSTPAIESIIRNGMIEDTQIAIDVALLDAVAGSVVRPPGLLNGVTPITPTAGGGIAAIQGDILAITAPFIAANAANGLVYIINPAVVNKLMFASTAVGVYPFKADAQAGNIGGIPFITSTLVPATTIILVRASDFASATGDTPEFDVSDTAVVHEEDGTYAADQTVTQPAATVEQIVTGGTAATPVRSFWQTATIGIRMLLDMDWAMRRTGMVQVINSITW